MRPSAIITPLSDSSPCGPDLNAAFDPAYEEYYFDAAGRLPGFYMQPGVERPDGSRSPDRIFDPKDVDHRAEKQAIEALLERSRDLRLLALMVQWDALAGRRSALADSIESMAALLEEYPAEVHPRLEDGPSDRRDAINDLNQMATVVQPVMFMGLNGTTEVTLRKIRVANGVSAPLEHEADLEIRRLMDGLSGPESVGKIREVHTDFLRLSNALDRIEASAKSNPDKAFSPNFDQLRPVVQEILNVLEQASPDLQAAAPEPAAQVEPDTAQPSDSGLQAPPVLAAAAQPQRQASPVVSQLHARRILEACEVYYRKAEPSSAALLLVVQARLLIGKPLIEALRTLLPAQASSAVVDFGAPSGFVLSADRLSELSAALPESMSAAPELPQDPGPDPKIDSAAQAAQAMRTVEDYFRRTECSSPVPVLLQRAQSYLDKDFQSLIEELIPQPNTS